VIKITPEDFVTAYFNAKTELERICARTGLLAYAVGEEMIERFPPWARVDRISRTQYVVAIVYCDRLGENISTREYRSKELALADTWRIFRHRYKIFVDGPVIAADDPNRHYYATQG
jgi:hypothetical protein